MADASISSKDALSYWGGVDASVDGMLGGFPQVSRIDLQGSKNCLAKLKKKTGLTTIQRAVDCGAGIGRITLGLLAAEAATVDIVEPVAKFTAEISEGASFADLRAAGKIGHVFTSGLEDWTPLAAGAQYDLVWCQWCVGQLRDDDLIDFLAACRPALSPKGWIVVKENVVDGPGAVDLFDAVDSSVTRTDAKFRAIFKAAGLLVAHSEVQRGFPAQLGLFGVRMYGLRPA